MRLIGLAAVCVGLLSCGGGGPAKYEFSRYRPSVVVGTAEGDRLYSLLLACRVGRRASGMKPYGLDVAVHSLGDARLVGRVTLIEKGDEYNLRNFAKVLGYDGDRVWVFGEGLWGFNPKTNTAVGEKELTAANPGLAGLWVKEAKFYGFDQELRRVTFRAANGGFFVMEPGSLKAVASEPRAERRAKDSAEYAELMAVHQDRSDLYMGNPRVAWRPGAYLDDNTWLGLLTDEDAEKKRGEVEWEVPRQGWQETDVRRFWRFRLRAGFDQWKAPQVQVAGMERVAGTEEFIEGGLLRKPLANGVVEVNDPAGFLVLHRSRIGGQGTWLVTRVDREGKVLRTVDTRLARVEQIVPDAKYVAFVGASPEPAHQQLNELRVVTIRPSDGARFDGEFR